MAYITKRFERQDLASMADWLAPTTQDWDLFFLSSLNATVEVEPVLRVIASNASVFKYTLTLSIHSGN